MENNLRKIRGSCLCGKVTFEIDKAVGPFEICHCSRCRKVSGSNGLAAVGVNTEDYHFLSGAEYIKTFAAPILHQPPAYHSNFCYNCGSPVPLVNPEDDWTEIPAGLFDDDLGISPDKHIFIEFTPAWDSIADDLPQFDQRQLYKHRTGKDFPPNT